MTTAAGSYEPWCTWVNGEWVYKNEGKNPPLVVFGNPLGVFQVGERVWRDNDPKRQPATVVRVNTKDQTALVRFDRTTKYGATGLIWYHWRDLRHITVRNSGARRTRRNPLEVSKVSAVRSAGVLLSRNVYVLAYRHAEDGKDYKHEFGASVYARLNADGSVTLYHKQGKPLWGDF